MGARRAPPAARRRAPPAARRPPRARSAPPAAPLASLPARPPILALHARPLPPLQVMGGLMLALHGPGGISLDQGAKKVDLIGRGAGDEEVSGRAAADEFERDRSAREAADCGSARYNTDSSTVSLARATRTPLV